MKINCDVCNKDQASVFCPADDAALCSACDHRVHRANNLAEKHPRFSLLPPSPKDSPLCDICQEGKALLFCQQDRAILCKDCDVAIHKVNEHTMNHCRFLITGVKLSPVAVIPVAGNGVVAGGKAKSGDKEVVSVKKPVAAAVWVPVVNRTEKMTTFEVPKSNGSGRGCDEGSSISEYLIETLPGWHVEDFLDSPPTYLKVDSDESAMFWDDEVLKRDMNDCFSPETMGIWVPQAPPPPAAPPPPTAPPLHNPYHHPHQLSNTGFGSQMISGSSLSFAPNKITKSQGRTETEDGNCFMVPQISPTTTSFKRSRTIR
ncbi:hypothetical protein SSX86_013967 [Deinandra increscens subsp. villosa]|uniref:B box-type domain-containing protein n=1 Tax=Deinandra increscens subsp. villosa TaxID=3103831 RepID=A0AAP0GZE8_9ASTR